MVKNFINPAIDRSRKFRLKNDPIVIALRFKARRVFFSPDEIKLQTFLDNWDMFLPEFFETYGYERLRRDKIVHFIHKFNTLIHKFRGLTLRNELIVLMDLLRLESQDVINVFEFFEKILIDEKFWTECEPVTLLDGFLKVINEREKVSLNSLTLSVEVINESV